MWPGEAETPRKAWFSHPHHSLGIYLELHLNGNLKVPGRLLQTLIHQPFNEKAVPWSTPLPGGRDEHRGTGTRALRRGGSQESVLGKPGLVRRHTAWGHRGSFTQEAFCVPGTVLDAGTEPETGLTGAFRHVAHISLCFTRSVCM